MIQSDIFSDRVRKEVTDWCFDKHDNYIDEWHYRSDLYRYYLVHLKHAPRIQFRMIVSITGKAPGSSIHGTLNLVLQYRESDSYEVCYQGDYDIDCMHPQCQLQIYDALAWNDTVTIPIDMLNDMMKVWGKLCG